LRVHCFRPKTHRLNHVLHLGIWPLIMGATMFLQMKLNPTPPDPTQKMMFD
jgi:YidC/Oxa1 family membrane protein insertase